MSKPGIVRRFLWWVWRGLSVLRAALANLLLLLVLLFLWGLYLGEAPEPMPDQAALLLNPVGRIVDQRSLSDPVSTLAGPADAADNEVLLRDIVDAIRYATDDPAINSMVMDLGALASAGLSKTQEIAEVMADFRASGKPIVAVADYYSQSQYALAVQADTIITHPMGGVALEGFSNYQNYYREALEKLSINMHVFRAGDFKSAVEPFTRDDMSDGEKAVSQRWLDALWSQYTQMIETRRSLEPGTVDTYIGDYAQRLERAGGDIAATAVEAGLVDELLSRREADDFVANIVGVLDGDGRYEAVAFDYYVARKRPADFPAGDHDEVAVITAQGAIVDGEQPPGVIGGETIAELLRAAIDHEYTRAVVLRVNSGGGSVFASEIIREAMLEVKQAELPLVVSMGAVAASGGYYIASPADEIWATPGTITGSIGVFAAFPTLEQLLDRLGVHTDGVGTTPLAGSFRADRPVSSDLQRVIGISVETMYRDFLQLVADGRGMSVEDVDAIAQGRVWSATDALEIGLVDKLGAERAAIDSAAELAGLEAFEIAYWHVPLSARDQFIQDLADRLGVASARTDSLLAGAFARLAQPIRAALQEFALFNDPGHLYIRCVSCAVY